MTRTRRTTYTPKHVTQAPPKRRRVAFSDDVVVHTVPRGGRDMEPGYKARTVRYAALKHHEANLKALGAPRLNRHSMNDLYGDGGKFRSRGSVGSYTDRHAAANTDHLKLFGNPLYVPKRDTRGYITFVMRPRKDPYAYVPRPGSPGTFMPRP